MAAYHVKVSAGGKVALPADLRRKHRFLPGSTLVVEDGQDGVSILSLDAAIARVQEIMKRAAPADRILSDELIADRRREAESE